MRRNHRWLHGEIDAWRQAGLIAPGQAETLRARYPLAESRLTGRLMLSTLGAAIIGLGVILFFAYNWAAMPKAAKLGILFSGLAACHAGGLWMRMRRQLLLSEILHLLGTMLFGAGIWLVSQIYHFDNPYPGAFVIWGLGALTLAWTLPSLPQAFLALALLVTWTLTGVGGAATEGWLLSSLLIAAGLVPLAIDRRSTALMLAAGAALMVVAPVELADLDADLVSLMLFGLCSVYLAAGRLAEGRARLAPVEGLAGLGILLFVPLVFFFSFEPLSAPGELPPGDWMGQAAMVLIIVLPIGLLLYAGAVAVQRASGRSDEETGRRDLLRIDAAWLLVVLAFHGYFVGASLGLLPSQSGWMTVPGSLTLLALGGLLIAGGALRQSMWRAGSGCLLVAAVTVARFTDLFESLLSRSLAFLVIGGAFIATGMFYNRHKQEPTEVHHA